MCGLVVAADPAFDTAELEAAAAAAANDEAAVEAILPEHHRIADYSVAQHWNFGPAEELGRGKTSVESRRSNRRHQTALAPKLALTLHSDTAVGSMQDCQAFALPCVVDVQQAPGDGRDSGTGRLMRPCTPEMEHTV